MDILKEKAEKYGLTLTSSLRLAKECLIGSGFIEIPGGWQPYKTISGDRQYLRPVSIEQDNLIDGFLHSEASPNIEAELASRMDDIADKVDEPTVEMRHVQNGDVTQDEFEEWHCLHEKKRTIEKMRWEGDDKKMEVSSRVEERIEEVLGASTSLPLHWIDLGGFSEFNFHPIVFRRNASYIIEEEGFRPIIMRNGGLAVYRRCRNPQDIVAETLEEFLEVSDPHKRERNIVHVSEDGEDVKMRIEAPGHVVAEVLNESHGKGLKEWGDQYAPTMEVNRVQVGVIE